LYFYDGLYNKGNLQYFTQESKQYEKKKKKKERIVLNGEKDVKNK
jgi:hypothetical protein